MGSYNSYNMSRICDIGNAAGEWPADYEPAQMHVAYDGPGEAPPILLVHGTAGSVAWWEPILAALSGRHHVIRVDLPGHGQSPPAPSYDVTAQAARLARVLDGIQADPVVGVGHSSGGYVVTALVEQRPDLVKSVALINTGPDPGAFFFFNSPAAVLSELFRVLAPSGRMAIHTAATAPAVIARRMNLYDDETLVRMVQHAGFDAVALQRTGPGGRAQLVTARKGQAGGDADGPGPPGDRGRSAIPRR